MYIPRFILVLCYRIASAPLMASNSIVYQRTTCFMSGDIGSSPLYRIRENLVCIVKILTFGVGLVCRCRQYNTTTSVWIDNAPNRTIRLIVLYHRRMTRKGRRIAYFSFRRIIQVRIDCIDLNYI